MWEETQVWSLGREDQRVGHNWATSLSQVCKGFPGGSAVKNPPAMQEMRIQSLNQKYTLEKEMLPKSSRSGGPPPLSCLREVGRARALPRDDLVPYVRAACALSQPLAGVLLYACCYAGPEIRRQTCLLNLYEEHIMRNPGLEEAQAGIRIARRNINNLRYVDDTTLMAESEEELKSLLMKVKEESEKVGWKLNIQKTKIVVSGPITSREIDRETVETVSDFILGGSKITADGDCSHEIKIRLLLGRKVMTNLGSILKSRDITLTTKRSI